METKNKKLLYDIAIGVGLVVYICLTTLIFINNKKIVAFKKSQQQTVDSKGVKSTKSTRTNTYEKNQVSDASGNIDVSIKKYTKKSQKEESNSEAYFKLGLLYMAKAGKEQEAIDNFNKALELNPQHGKKRAIELWMKQLQTKLNKRNEN